MPGCASTARRSRWRWGAWAFANALVIGVALSLPAGGYALLENLRGVAGGLALDPQISLFLQPGRSARTPRRWARPCGPTGACPRCGSSRAKRR